MAKSSHEEHLFQPLQTNIKQFKLAVTFLTVYNGIFNATNSSNKVYFIKSITHKDGYIHITMPLGAYEIENLNNEIKSNTIEDGHYRETDYQLTFKANFSTHGSFIEISTQGPIITFIPQNSIRDLLGFNLTTIYEKYNLFT